MKRKEMKDGNEMNEKRMCMMKEIRLNANDWNELCINYWSYINEWITSNTWLWKNVMKKDKWMHAQIKKKSFQVSIHEKDAQ